MELEQLRIFAALCETGGFSSAARRLYKSHSSVSRAVSALERELGVKLCVRDSRSFAVTEAGARLYDGAKALLAAAEELEKSVKGSEGVKNGRANHTAPQKKADPLKGL